MLLPGSHFKPYPSAPGASDHHNYNPSLVQRASTLALVARFISIIAHIPGPKTRTWGTHSFVDGRTWATRPDALRGSASYNAHMANSKQNLPTINLLTPERLILAYLYNNPGKDVESAKLITVLNPEAKNTKIGEITTEQVDQMLSAAQENVETLILYGLVKGKRALKAGKVVHTKLELTAKGEVAAIRHLREPEKIVLDI